MKVENEEYILSESELKEFGRLFYLIGGNDGKEGNFSWCQQGSKERVKDIFDGVIYDAAD